MVGEGSVRKDAKIRLKAELHILSGIFPRVYEQDHGTFSPTVRSPHGILTQDQHGTKQEYQLLHSSTRSLF